MESVKPKKIPETKSITLKVTEHDLNLIKWAAGLNRSSISAYVRQLIIADIENNKESIEAFKRLVEKK